MRSTPRYPVDRYMVESSKNKDMVNIIDDDLWNPEPALRPEDEMLLRKLQDMLQSTSDDLKLLSGELSKYHKPSVLIKTALTPLDEEFNEKVHIEELVNARFHGYNIIDKSFIGTDVKIPNGSIKGDKAPKGQPIKPKVTNSAVQVNPIPETNKKSFNRNLGLSRTKIVQINEKNEANLAVERLNNGKIIRSVPAVAYNEFSFKQIEPEIKENKVNNLQVQAMPSINIRSELIEQRVLNIDILPDNSKKKDLDSSRSNIAVVSITHDKTKQVEAVVNDTQNTQSNYIKPVKKVSKMSTGESSESTNISSDTKLKLTARNKLNAAARDSPRIAVHLNRRKKSSIIIKGTENRKTQNLDEWKRKLNVIYGNSNPKNIKSKNLRKRASPKKLTSSPKTKMLNNAEYIPYSKLTVGGIKVSDLERELRNIPNKSNDSLSQVFDQILSSKEHSPRNHKTRNEQKNLTTSDENLLQEVIDIEKTISDTISKNISKKDDKVVNRGSSDENIINESYADDFEDDKSYNTLESQHEARPNNVKELNKNAQCPNCDEDIICHAKEQSDKTYIKTSNLSIKDSVDIFEFIHSVDTHDTATQSSTSNKILPKETQTSPRNEKPNIQPIHNDLWSSLDSKGEIERMLKLEKELIKKIIVEEYGELLEDNITKPSTSEQNVEENKKNLAASQKNTQTSPARVKNVMTSPKRTKTRTTSPLIEQSTVTIDRQTSPLTLVTNEANVENHDITINLSSPRFSLRFPQNSREVLSNLDVSSTTSSKVALKSKLKKYNTSSSSIDAGSSSELSSLGEVRLAFKKRFKKSRVPTVSDSSSSSTVSKYSLDIISGGVIPLRSEGEISLGQRTKKISNRSEGETSFGVVK